MYQSNDTSPPIINSSEGSDLLPSSYTRNDFEGLFDTAPEEKQNIISTPSHHGHEDLNNRSLRNLSQSNPRYNSFNRSSQVSSTSAPLGSPQQVTINKKELLLYLARKRLQERSDLKRRLIANAILQQLNQRNRINHERTEANSEHSHVQQQSHSTTLPSTRDEDAETPNCSSSTSRKRNSVVTTPLMSQLYPSSNQESVESILEEEVNSRKRRRYSKYSLTPRFDLSKKEQKTQSLHRYVKVVASKMPESHKNTEQSHALSPRTNYQNLLSSRSYDKTCFDSMSKYYTEPSQLQKASFGRAVAGAIDTRDCKSLKQLLSSGLSPNPSNQFGDSILNTVCRRGHEDLFHVMINCGASVLTSDQFGRTPLHFVCWSSNVSFSMVEKILSFDLNMLRATDKVGKTPLDYISVDRWDVWNQFLKDKQELFWPRDEIKRREHIASSIHNVAKSPSLPDPKNALSLEEAKMVSSGSLTL